VSHRTMLSTAPLWWALLEVRSVNTSSQQDILDRHFLLVIIADTADMRHCKVLHRLRAVFQELSDIGAISERFFFVSIFLGEDRRLAA
jgi:hypothetical protein